MKARANRRGPVEKPDLSVLGPIREIIRLVEEGKRSKSQLQAFVEGQNPFVVSSPLNIDGVIGILGENKVITAQQAYTAFKRTFVADQAVDAVRHLIRYSEETLRECAVLNRFGDRDWRLVYGIPFSLRQQREIVGVDMTNQPCFYDNDWWLDERQEEWATSQPTAGYYLIDFKCRFEHTHWLDQENRIFEMGDVYERADERVFSQALISIFQTHNERLHERTYHWGRMETVDRVRVFVGHFGSTGIEVTGGSTTSDNNGCCIARKFEL